MNKKKQAKSGRTTAKVKRNDPKRLRTYLLMLVCSLLLVSGFFFAARQHFSSMDYGMKNSRLRRQIDELEAEKRRLMLAREVSLSPAEIKKAARKTGLSGPASVEGEVAQLASTRKEKSLSPTVSETNPMIVKTAAVSIAAPRATVASAKNDKIEKQLKKPIFAE